MFEFDFLVDDDNLSEEANRKLRRERLIYGSIIGAFLLLFMILGLYVLIGLSPGFQIIGGEQPGYPRVMGVDPEGEIDRYVPVRIAFNRPMVKEDVVGELIDTLPVRVQPELNVKYRWEKQDELNIEFEEEIPVGTRVTVTVPRELQDLSGKYLSEARQFQFVYKPITEFRVTRQQRNRFWSAETPDKMILNLEFDRPVDAEDLKPLLTVRDEQGQEVDYHFATEQADRTTHQIVVKSDDLADQTLKLSVQPGLRTTVGNYPTQQTLSAEHSLGHLELRYVDDEVDDWNPYLELRFNHNISNVNNLWRYIEITGIEKVNVTSGSYSSEIEIHSDEFEFGKEYTVRLKPGLRAGIYKLQTETTESETIRDAYGEVEIPIRGQMLTRDGKRALPVKHVNADTLYVTAYEIYDHNLVHYGNYEQYSADQPNLFRKLGRTKFVLPGEKNEVRTDYFKLDQLYGESIQGPKILKFSSNTDSYLDEKFLNLTNLGLTVKQADDGMMSLVTSLIDGTPRPDATVSLYSESNLKLDEVSTDKNGIAHFKRSDQYEEEPSLVIARSDDGDMNYLPLNRGEVSLTGFNTEGERFPQPDDWDASIYGERELVRPGETARLQAIVRRHDLEETPSFPVDVEIENPRGEHVFSRSLQPDEFGRVSFQYRPPHDAPTGNYSVRIQHPTENYNTIGQFDLQVEEFVPERIETKVKLTPDSQPVTEPFKLTVNGAFLHGEPAEGNRVTAQYTLNPIPFESKQYPDYNFGDQSLEFESIRESLGSGELDKEGDWTTEFTVPGGLRPPAALEVRATGTVFDLGASGVSSTASATVFPYPHYIGIKPMIENPEGLESGQKFPFRFVAVNPAGGSVEPREVEVSVYERDWRYTLKEQADGGYRYSWEEQFVPVHQDQVQVGSQPVDWEFTVPGWGRYRVEITDPVTGARATTNFSAGRWWVRDDARRVDFDRAELQFGQQRYQPGDQARVRIEAPFDGTAYAFLEGSEAQFLRRVEVKDGSAEFTFPVKREYSPNRYVTVHVLRGTSSTSQPSLRAIGVKPLRVDDPSARLNVSIQPDGEAKPGETLPVVLETERDLDHGKVALSVVDVGILQQARQFFANPYEHFFRQRGYFVDNLDIYSYIQPDPEVEISDPLEPPGDAMAMERAAQAQQQLPDPVQPVETISMWYPDVELDDGRATVDVPMPEYTGRLRMRAWVTGEGAAGQGSHDQSLREAIRVEPRAPRAGSPGDKFDVPVEVSSNLEEPAEFRLTVDRGAPIIAKGSTVKTFQLQPGERRRFWFSFAVEDAIGNPELTFRASAKDKQSVRTVTVPIRPPYGEITEQKFHRIDAGDNLSLNPGNRFYRGTESTRVVLSGMPESKLFSSLHHLITYPYGCLEQTVSSVFPQLYLRPLLEAANWDKDRQEEIKYNVQEGIDRVLRFALPDGTFPRWPGGDGRYDYGTLYAAHFLTEANRAGYTVPDRALSKLQGHLRSVVNHGDKDHHRAYAAYILGLSGEHHVPVAESLVDELSGYYERYYAIGALLLAGKEDRVRDQLYERSPAVGVEERTTGGTLRSQSTGLAVILNSLLEADKELPAMETMVQQLMNGLENNRWSRWGTTHDNAQALIALGKYYQEIGVTESEFTGTLLVDGEPKLNFDSDEDTTYVLPEPKPITVETSGNGPVFVSVLRSGVPTEAPDDVQRNMKVKQSFHTVDGDTIEMDNLDQGKLYVVETTVITDRNHDNMYIEDKIPGGFELENPRLATSVYDIPFLNEGDVASTIHEDLRDDRITLFFDGDYQESKYTFRYPVRAVTRGTFVAPNLTGESMYHPEVHVRQSRDTVTIR